jgi:hypothetical protein
MKSRRLFFTLLRPRIALVALFLSAASSRLSGAEMKVEDVVARHLDSIGTAEARSAAKTRLVQGTSRFKIALTGGGELPGASALLSEGRKAVVMIKLANGDYRGEQFVTDGDKVYVAATASSHRRTSFGEFVHSQDQIVREGLMGGTLTTAWALLNLDANKPKLSYNGLKKINGAEVYEISYHSRKKDDLTVHLYFDKDTYRHVITTYAVTLASGLAPNSGVTDITQTAKQKETRYTIEEQFNDFRTADGLTLPSKYVIHFTQELQDGTTEVYEWDITADEVSNNVGLDPKNFQVK